MNADSRRTWALDREIVLSRVIAAPRERVFQAWSDPKQITQWYGSDKDNDPARFHVTVTFDAQSDGKTVLTMRQLHPTKEQRDATIGFGAVEFGYQTLGKLARHLGVS